MINMIEVMLDDGVVALADVENIEKAVKTSCLEAKGIENPSLCLRFAQNEDVQQLNAVWRNQDKVTDVLSFPMQDMAEWDGEASLGDMIFAVPFVRQEAARLQLPEQDHALHLIVHSTLHLLGYDHIDDEDALLMQGLEQTIMHQLGLHIPYPELSFTPPATKVQP